MIAPSTMPPMLAEAWVTPWIGCWIGAFVAGSIPFGLLIARAHGIDIRTKGSGNIGATNVGRVLGKRWGMLCFLLDAMKGALPVLWAGWSLGLFPAGGWRPEATALEPWTQAGWIITALAAVLGHMFTPWAGFKGGKGVATAFGALLAMWPIATIPVVGAGVIFAATALLSRYVSLGSILASIALPVLVWLWGGRDLWPTVTLTAILGAGVIWKHRSNIARLRAGTENRLQGATHP